jgi:hypothetical protein
METTKDLITGTTAIEEDPISGDLFLTFPDEVAEAVGMNDWEWVNWDLQPDGTVLITKGQGPDVGDEGDHF